MPQQPTPNKGSLDSKRIEDFLRLAMAAPDEALLRRHFAGCAGQPASAPLTDVERRWVVTNLQANASWQEHWQGLEAELGRPVSWVRKAMPDMPKTVAQDRPSVKQAWRSRLLTAQCLAPAAVLLVVFLYGVLWLTGRLLLPPTYALTSLTDYQEALTETVRSSQTDTRSDFARGAEALLAAPQSTIGLFPHHDRGQAERALTHLRRAFEQVQDPFERAEMAFFLAKASLMKDDVSSARHWLEQVLAQNVADYREDAATLLRQLEEGPARP